MTSFIAFLTIVTATELTTPGHSAEKMKKAEEGYEDEYEKWYEQDLHERMEQYDQAARMAYGEKGAPAKPYRPEKLDNLHKAVRDVHENVASVLDKAFLGESPEGYEPGLADHHADLHEMHAPVAGLLAAVNDSATDAAMPAVLAQSSLGDGAKQAMLHLAGSVKMLVLLQPMLAPLRDKLEGAMLTMPAEGRQHAVEILRHVNALDDYARTTQGLMKNVLAAKDGTKEEKRASMVALVDGVKSIAVGVHANLAALRWWSRDHAADKLNKMLHRMASRIAHELEDPEMKDDPKVAVDVKMFLAVKESVKKSHALMAAAATALKKATDGESRALIKGAAKIGMKRVAQDLKATLDGFKLELVALKKKKTTKLLRKKKASTDEEDFSQEGSSKESSDDDDSKFAKADDDEDKTTESKGEKKKGGGEYHGNEGWDLDQGTDEYQHGGSKTATKKGEHKTKKHTAPTPAGESAGWKHIFDELDSLKHKSKFDTVDGGKKKKRSAKAATEEDDDAATTDATEKSQAGTSEWDLFDGKHDSAKSSDEDAASTDASTTAKSDTGAGSDAPKIGLLGAKEGSKKSAKTVPMMKKGDDDDDDDDDDDLSTASTKDDDDDDVDDDVDDGMKMDVTGMTKLAAHMKSAGTAAPADQGEDLLSKLNSSFNDRMKGIENFEKATAAMPSSAVELKAEQAGDNLKGVQKLRQVAEEFKVLARSSGEGLLHGGLRHKARIY